MKLMREMAIREQGGELPVERQQAFLVAARKKEVRSLCRLARSSEHKRIVPSPRLTSPGVQRSTGDDATAKPVSRKRSESGHRQQDSSRLRRQIVQDVTVPV